MDRITMRDLEQALRAYCTASGRPLGHYKRVDAGEDPGAGWAMLREGLAAQTGGLALDGAYGGWEVHEIIGTDPAYVREGEGPCTGVRVALWHGHISKREAYNRLSAATEAARWQVENGKDQDNA